MPQGSSSYSQATSDELWMDAPEKNIPFSSVPPASAEPPPPYEDDYQKLVAEMRDQESLYSQWQYNLVEAERKSILCRLVISDYPENPEACSGCHHNNDDLLLRNHYRRHVVPAGRCQLVVPNIIVIQPVPVSPAWPPMPIPQRRASAGAGRADREKIEPPVLQAFCGVALLFLLALVLGPYGIKKTSNALRNISQGRKVPRSLFRLAGIGAGIAGGVMLGASVGATLGSVVPGLGTAAGMLVGMIAGGLTGAGLGALVSKYIAKAFSFLSCFLLGNRAVSETCPEKYTLSEEVKDQLNPHLSGCSVTSMLTALRTQKNSTGLAGSFPGSSARKQKSKGNTVLRQIQAGVLPTQNGKYLFWRTHDRLQQGLAWHTGDHRWYSAKLSQG